MLQLIALALFATSCLAQSAKFAVVWDDTAKVLRSCADAATDLANDDIIQTDVCPPGVMSNNTGYTFASIKVPQNSELLVSLSAQVELYTTTTVKGRKGSLSTSVADAEGGAMLFACPLGERNFTKCSVAAPGYVALNQRRQELSAVLGGIIEECTFTNPIDDSDISFNLDDCVVAREEIKLALQTLSAHSFNFVFVDCAAGEYDIVAKFFTKAQAEAFASCPTESEYCEEGDGQAAAISEAFIGKYTLAVQQVRAVRNAPGSREIVEL